MSNLAVILPAAGKGERFGGTELKTFTKLDGRAVFLRSIELFINRDDVIQTILVVPTDDMPELKDKFGANLGFMGVQAVEGGATRRASVKAGLDAVKEEAEFVVIHDAVRPCTSGDLIDAVLAEAVKCGAAIPACPLAGTIKRVSGANVIDETVPREGLWEAQTPQIFRRELIVNAHNNDPDQECTDDAQLLEWQGVSVSVVQGDPTNIKITTKGDLTLANAILKSRPAPKVRKFGAFDEAQW
jgi:2-C-methyl-D-erythritol 4-phosphate cytidylyltransferase